MLRERKLSYEPTLTLCFDEFEENMYMYGTYGNWKVKTEILEK